MTNLHKLSKSKVQLRRGSLLKMDDGDYLLKEFLSSSEVLLQKVEDKKVKVAKLNDIITDVIQAAPSENLASEEILAIPPNELKAAKRKFKAIEPILELGSTASVQDIKIQAVKSGVHYVTLYRWLNAYLATNSLVSLINQKRGWTKKNTRTDDEVNKIIEHCIESYYLTKTRLTPKMVYNRIKEACKTAGLKTPSQSTIYRRIDLIPEEQRLRSRGHLELANNRFSARAGKFPNVDSILSVIQVDHTPLDIIIVDDEHRESIKRVWLTMAIDIYSRMVTGFYLSLDAPSTTSVAMCLSHSILPKQQWLKHLDIDLEWSVWGIPKKVHVDNGADFTSDALRIGCLENNINLEFRPVAKPQYGGHIERLLGAFQNRLKELDGKTFNSPKARGSYDSEKNAIFDFDALEKWLTNAIIEYHHTKHDSIGVPPVTKWLMSVEGELEELPHGWPDVPADPLSIEISFLPYKERTIRSQGVVWDGIYYFSDNIRHLIGLRDPETRKPRKYILRRDPRNIRYVWVYDEEIKSYHKVGLADPTLNFTSIWELNEAKLYLKKKGQSAHNQDVLSQAVNNMREIEEQARKKTKDARRRIQRKKNHQKNITPAQHFAAQEQTKAISTEASPQQETDDWDSSSDIDTFDIE